MFHLLPFRKIYEFSKFINIPWYISCKLDLINLLAMPKIPKNLIFDNNFSWFKWSNALCKSQTRPLTNNLLFSEESILLIKIQEVISVHKLVLKTNCSFTNTLWYYMIIWLYSLLYKMFSTILKKEVSRKMGL